MSSTPRPRIYTLIYSGTTWVCAALILCALAVALLLLVCILSHIKLRLTLFNQSLVSMAVAGIFFNAVLKPGTILHENGAVEMSKWYCGVCLLLQKAEWLFMPLTIWMMSIEIILAIHKPENFEEKMTKAARASLLSVPWVFSFGFGIFIIFILGTNVLTRNEWLPWDSAAFDCLMAYEHTVAGSVHRLWDAFGCGIPVTALSLTTIVLLMVSYAAYTKNGTIKVHNDKGQLLVSPESIIFSLLLNLSAISILMDDALSALFGRYPMSNSGFVLSHWAWTILGMCADVVAMCVLSDVRQSMKRLCCCCCNVMATGDGDSLVDEPEEIEVSASESTAALPTETFE